MHFKRIAAGLVGLLALAAAVLSGPAIAADAAWVHYSNTAMGVSVDFPSATTSKTTPGQNERISWISYNTSAAPGSGGLFELEVTDYPDATSMNAPVAIQGGIDALLDTAKGVLVWRSDTTVEGYPAADFVVRAQGASGSYLVRGRIVIRGLRAYVLCVNGEPGNATPAGTDQFIGSLKMSADKPGGH